MSTENKQSGKSPESPEWIPAPGGVHEIYTNYAHPNWGIFDLRVKFGQLMPRPGSHPDANDWIVEERGAITIAWPHAKFLHTMLGNLLASYEKANGELKPLKLPEKPE